MLLLRRHQLPGGITIDPPCYLFIGGVDKPNFVSFFFDGLIDGGASIPELIAEPIFDEQELSHHEGLDGSAHEVEG